MTRYEIECLKYFRYQLTLRDRYFDLGQADAYLRANETIRAYYKQEPQLTEQLKAIETESIRTFFKLGETI